MLIVVDIDDTLADASGRRLHAGPPPPVKQKKAYTAWLDALQPTTGPMSMLEDNVVPGMKDLVLALSALPRSTTVYITSREEKYRAITQDWLSQYGFPPHQLLMRPAGSWEKASDLKEKEIVEIASTKWDDRVIVIDDDPSGELEACCARRGWILLKARSGQ